jgi:DNA-binding SARP family transcriptional activator
MALENGMPIKTEGMQLDLNFDLWVRDENVFGTAFRVITNNNENIDLMYSVDEDGSRLPFLLTGEDVHFFQRPARMETWLNITLSLNCRNGRIVLQYDDEKIELTHEKLKETKSVRIAFGRCPFEGFVLDDVASVNIKDVSLKRDDRQIRFWKMAQHVGDICYDEISGVPAIGRNTQWIIDDLISWRKIYGEKFNTIPAIAFDSIGGKFFITTDTFLYTISLSPENENGEVEVKTDSSLISGGRYAAGLPNHMIYIASEQQLLSYNLTEHFYSVFDLTRNRWKNRRAPAEDPNYWNNTVVYNPVDSTLISFGGYGHYLYSHELLLCYPFHEEKPPQHIPLPDIAPRYSPASVLVGDQLYIFGGRGSPSGRQELFPRNYYDLYAVNITDKTVKKYWSWAGTLEYGDFVPSENMIYDHENQCFYVFTSQLNGVLMKIDTVHPAFEQMSLPIDIIFNTHYMFTNLFLAPGLQKLYAYILLSEVNGESTLEIYEMNYPPLPISVTSMPQIHTAEGKSGFWKKYDYLPGILFLGIILSGIARYYRKKRRTGQKEKTPAPHSPATSPRSLMLEKEPVSQYYDFSKKCICFLDRFKALDKKGTDITAQFSPILQSLLIALICYSVKDSRGISGNKLIKLLWQDKSEEAAKNNRNVYVSKLRTILEEIGDLKIINKNSFWRIQIDDDTLCDYWEIMKLFKEKENQDLERMLELLIRGGMLPNIETDWVDPFKNDFANTAIDFCVGFLKKFDLTDSLKLKIADTLFQHDFLNEEALQIKCSVLYQQNKVGLAKTVYDTFCNIYKSSLGIDYPCSFMQVVKPA